MGSALLATLLIITQVQPIAEDKPLALTVEYGELTVPVDDGGAPLKYSVADGVYLNHAAAIAVAAHMKGLQAENDSLKKALDEKPAPSNTWYLLGGAALLGLAAGAAAAFTLTHH